MRPISVAAGLLFLSGFAALVYQTLWFRLLGLVFGVTVYAASTVLAAFMAGLALGSVLAGRLSDRVARPLRWFGVAELLIAGAALATPVALAGLETFYRALHAALGDQTALFTLARFLASFAVLLVPTTLMGATVPLVLRASTARVSDVGRHSALLYAANTAGALAGALLTGYYFVSSIGITASFAVAAACNILAGIAALLFGARRAPGVSTVAAVTHPDPSFQPLSSRTRAIVLAVFGVSGFVALALEIVWFRALLMFLPATVYAFTTILAVVLGGIAAGSALMTRALRREGDWLSRLAVLELLIPLAALGSFAVQSWTYAAGWRTGAALQASALAVLPAMLLMGAAFPIGLHCWSAVRDEHRSRIGERVGWFYLVNLAGSIAGAIAAGFLVIPWVGARGALIGIAAVGLAGGVALLAATDRSRSWKLVTGAPALAAFIILGLVVPDPLAAVLARRYPGETLLWRQEDAQSTVSVQDRAGTRVMYLDGLHQANDSEPMVAMHRLIGAMAMALHPDPRRVLVIGLGGGVTPGATSLFPDALIEVVELSPGVVAGSEWFRHVNHDLLRRPGVHLRVGDGRNHLLLTPDRYDVITADIIQPFHAGAGNLYSREYFDLAARTLDDDGLMLQWIGHRPKSQYTLIARTFQSAFPHATLWSHGTLLAGTRQPLRLSAARYRERLRDPEFRRALAAAGLDGFESLLGQYTAGPGELRAFLGGGPLLTDDRPLVEYFRSLPRGEGDIDLSGLWGEVRRHVVD
jgi:spermidine synthase